MCLILVVFYWVTVNIRKHHLRDVQEKRTPEIHKPIEIEENINCLHQRHTWRKSLYKICIIIHVTKMISFAYAFAVFFTFFEHNRVAASDYRSELCWVKREKRNKNWSGIMSSQGITLLFFRAMSSLGDPVLTSFRHIYNFQFKSMRLSLFCSILCTWCHFSSSVNILIFVLQICF